MTSLPLMTSSLNVTPPPMPLFPAIDWCFDIEVFYASSEANVASAMQKHLRDYKRFSQNYNGIATCFMVALGLTGSILLLLQIHSSRLFSKRLAVHLGMICVWDSLYLLSCFATYGLPSLLYGLPPSYGLISYVLIVLQPFASFCVSCTIWQVVAITLERYWAVSKPLEQRTRMARFGVGWICVAIALGAFIINLLPVPFERHLVPCFEIAGDAYKNYTLLKPYDDNESRLYRFVVHFFPDLLFRTPCPIIIIAVLTVKTIQHCNQRTVGDLHINGPMRRNIPLRLSLLNFKFILCNTLYMFNTILLELLGYGESVDSNEEGKIDRYMNSYYLTDASNLLLVLHSTTNWLVFYHWPTKSNRQFTSISFSASVKQPPVRPQVASFVLHRIAPFKSSLGTEILATLSVDYAELRQAILGDAKMTSFATFEQLMKADELRAKGATVGAFIEQVLKWFSRRRRGESIREMGRRLGQANFDANMHFNAEEWKDIRKRVVGIIVRYAVRDAPSLPCSYSDIHDNVVRAFNFVLSELRSGTLCAAVEAHQRIQTQRSHSTCVWSTPMEVTRKTRSISQTRIRYPVVTTGGPDQPLLVSNVNNEQATV